MLVGRDCRGAPDVPLVPIAAGVGAFPLSSTRGGGSGKTPATVPKAAFAECISQYSVGSVPREKYSV